MSRAIMNSVMLICCVCLLALAAANAHSRDVCDVETLTGGYGFGANGFLLLGDDMVPTAAIGDFTFDGAGNVSGVATQNANGLVVLIPQKGTYMVNADCTGSVGTTDRDGMTRSFDIVIVNEGDEVVALGRNPELISAFSLKRK